MSFTLSGIKMWNANISQCSWRVYEVLGSSVDNVSLGVEQSLKTSVQNLLLTLLSTLFFHTKPQRFYDVVEFLRTHRISMFSEFSNSSYLKSYGHSFASFFCSFRNDFSEASRIGGYISRTSALIWSSDQCSPLIIDYSEKSFE